MNAGDFLVNFGSYRGKTLSAIYRIDKAYVLWLRDDCRLTEVRRAATDFIRSENERIIATGKRLSS